MEEQKVCSKCGETKPGTAEFFHRMRGGLRSECKVCVNNHKRAQYEANPEIQKERSRAWRHANLERTKEYQRAWREANPERVREGNRAWREVNPERDKATKRAWYEANLETARAARQRRRAHNRNAEGNFTAADIKAQYKRQKGRCFWCNEKVDDNYHVDHVVPLSRGGSNWPDNLVVACATCNCSKGDKMPHEFPQGGRLL